MKKINKFFMTIVLTVASLSLTVSPVFASQASADPTYQGIERISAEKLEDDYIYTFSDGTINPQYNEPILMINGTFYATTPLVATYSSFSAPLRGVAEALGADVIWDEVEKKVTIKYNNSIIELPKGRYGTYSVSINGQEIRGYLEPDIINNQMYLPLQFFMQIFNLEAGYLPSSRMGIGFGIADNPVIWLDRPGTYENSAKAQNEGLEWLKDELYKGFENFKKNNENGPFSEDVAREASKIAEDIKNTKYVGQIGRYSVYLGAARTILVDYDTNTFYFYRSEHAYEYIIKPDMNDSGLFYMGYVTG